MLEGSPARGVHEVGLAPRHVVGDRQNDHSRGGGGAAATATDVTDGSVDMAGATTTGGAMAGRAIMGAATTTGGGLWAVHGAVRRQGLVAATVPRTAVEEHVQLEVAKLVVARPPRLSVSQSDSNSVYQGIG